MKKSYAVTVIIGGLMMGMGNRFQSDTWWGHSLHPITPNLQVLGYGHAEDEQDDFHRSPFLQLPEDGQHGKLHRRRELLFVVCDKSQP